MVGALSLGACRLRVRRLRGKSQLPVPFPPALRFSLRRPARSPGGSPISIRLRWQASPCCCATRPPASRYMRLQPETEPSALPRLDAGEYTLEADAPQLGHGELEGILVTGGAEARVQAAMQFEPTAPRVLEAAAPSEIPARPLPAASMPLRAYAVPGTSGPAAALPSAIASRAMGSTSKPETVAAASQRSQLTLTAPRGSETVQPSSLPAEPQPAVVRIEMPACTVAAVARCTRNTIAAGYCFACGHPAAYAPAQLQHGANAPD